MRTRKIKLTNNFGEQLIKIAEKLKRKPDELLAEALSNILPPEETKITKHSKKVAKELMIKYQGKYGFPKLKN